MAVFTVRSSGLRGGDTLRATSTAPPTPVYDTSGSTAMTGGATSTTIDITAAAVGAKVFAWIAIGLKMAPQRAMR
jgi:hypothetical protein